MPPFKKFKLEEVVDIIMGQSPEGHTCNKNGKGVPLLNGPTEFGDKFPTAVQYTTDPKKFSEVGDILFCVRGSTTGRMNLSDRQYAIGRGLAAIRHKKGKHLQSFVKGLIDTILPKMLQNVTGSTFPNLSKEQLNNYEVEIPEDLPTQTRIASILSSLDDKIELNRRTNHTLEQMAQTLFKKYFVDDIDPENLPEGWSYEKVNDLYDISIGRTPPRVQHEWFSTNPKDVMWISIKDMGVSGIYISETSEYLTSEAVKKFNIPVIPNNTVVLSFKLTVGRVAITTERMLSNEAIAHFIPKSSTYLTSEYVYLFLKNLDYDSLGNTSSIATAVNSQTIKGIKMLIPDKEKVRVFSSTVVLLFKKIKTNQEEIKALCKLRDSLLPKLMSGEIEVNAIEKEFVN